MSTKNSGPKRISFTAVAKSKKTKTPRQKFLSAIMGETSGEVGEEMANAFAKGQTDKLRGLLEGMVETVIKKASRQK